MSKSIILEAVMMVWKLKRNKARLITTPSYVPVPEMVEKAALGKTSSKEKKPVGKVKISTPIPRP